MTLKSIEKYVLRKKLHITSIYVESGYKLFRSMLSENLREASLSNGAIEVFTGGSISHGYARCYLIVNHKDETRHIVAYAGGNEDDLEEAINKSRYCAVA